MNMPQLSNPKRRMVHKEKSLWSQCCLVCLKFVSQQHAYCKQPTYALFDEGRMEENHVTGPIILIHKSVCFASQLVCYCSQCVTQSNNSVGHYWPETQTKRNATQHDCLPSLLGDGEKRIKIIYGEKKKHFVLGLNRAVKEQQKYLAPARQAQRAKQPRKDLFPLSSLSPHSPQFQQSPEAEFLDIIRTKGLRVFLLAIDSHLY